jgi:hypothetical protein
MKWEMLQYFFIIWNILWPFGIVIIVPSHLKDPDALHWINLFLSIIFMYVLWLCAWPTGNCWSCAQQIQLLCTIQVVQLSLSKNKIIQTCFFALSLKGKSKDSFSLKGFKVKES